MSEIYSEKYHAYVSVLLYHHVDISAGDHYSDSGVRVPRQGEGLGEGGATGGNDSTISGR